MRRKKMKITNNLAKIIKEEFLQDWKDYKDRNNIEEDEDYKSNLDSYIEEWVPDDEKCRDGYPSDSWKMCKTPIVHEFEEEDEFKNKLFDIINNGGVISKVYIKKS